jgi:hypothetical protein
MVGACSTDGSNASVLNVLKIRNKTSVWGEGQRYPVYCNAVQSGFMRRATRKNTLLPLWTPLSAPVDDTQFPGTWEYVAAIMDASSSTSPRHTFPLKFC